MSQMETMSRSLVRGTHVVIADSFGKPALRGAKQVVAGKGAVKCNRKGRCAGDWCIGLAVFLTDPGTMHDEKDMGWRSGTRKVCLTHVRNEEGDLILPPPAMHVAQEALGKPVVTVVTPSSGPVTWEELADVVNKRDLATLAILARRLKRENEGLQRQVIETQAKLIEHYTR